MVLRIFLIASLALPVSAQAGGQGPAAKEPVDAGREVARLLRTVHDANPPPLVDLVGSLVHLGPAGAEELVAICVGAAEPPLPPENAVAPLPGFFTDAERPSLEDVLAAAIEALPPGEVVAAVRVRAMGSVPAIIRANGIRVLGEVGTGRALEALLESVAEVSDFERAHPGFVETATGALAAILSGDEHGWHDLERRLQDPDPRWERLLVRGIARSGSPRGFSVLVDLLRRPTADKELLLGAIEELSEKAAPWVSEQDCADLRHELDSQDPVVQRNAVVVLARLHDVESVPRIIEFLGSEDGRLQRGAVWALETMSGLSLPPEGPRWREWYDAQIRWFDDFAPTLRRKLESGAPADAVEAIAQMCQRPLFRHRMAEELARPLAYGPVQIARAACAGLAQLRSPRALPALVQALHRPEEDVRAAAREALVAITGRELPADFDAWAGEVRP